jgi:hypothetical protein
VGLVHREADATTCTIAFVGLAYIPTRNAFVFINNLVMDTVFFFMLLQARRKRQIYLALASAVVYA